MMQPIEKFSFQYNVEEYKLLEYVYPVAQEYAPDFDYNENTGESFMAVSQVPDIFKGRYNARKLRHKFTVEEYNECRRRRVQQFGCYEQYKIDKFGGNGYN